MKILSVVGARPEFIQAMPIRRVLQAGGKHHEVWVHTGQHYDYRMSQAFFDELGAPKPDYNLDVGSGRHGWQTAAILGRVEEVLIKERPDLVIVRGDTNSTVASALAAAKLGIPIAHVEAGERSYDRRMPEELNRLVTDCLSDVHFCATRLATRRLASEGITDQVYFVGDVMLDAALQNMDLADQKSQILAELGVEPGRYALVTVHRAANTDDPKRLLQIVRALNSIPEPMVFPVHPRTEKLLAQLDVRFANHIRRIPPVGYFDMMVLEKSARLIATDSGGVQREAYFWHVPCLTLRDETEWTETVEVGWNRLVGANEALIRETWFHFAPPAQSPPLFGDGRAAAHIAAIIDQWETASVSAIEGVNLESMRSR